MDVVEKTLLKPIGEVNCRCNRHMNEDNHNESVIDESVQELK